MTVTDGPFAGEYPTVVEHVSPKDGSIVVGMPISKGEVVPIPVGTRVHVHQYGQAVYVFDAVVTAHRNDPVSVIVLKAPEKVTRMQRRLHVRMGLSATARVEVVGEDGPSSVLDGTRLCDVSAGGAGFISRHPLEKGTRVLVHIPSMRIRTPGEVVRVVANGDPDKPLDYRVGVRFVEMSEEEATRITRLIFQEQMNQRRKGLA